MEEYISPTVSLQTPKGFEELVGDGLKELFLNLIATWQIAQGTCSELVSAVKTAQLQEGAIEVTLVTKLQIGSLEDNGFFEAYCVVVL